MPQAPRRVGHSRGLGSGGSELPRICARRSCLYPPESPPLLLQAACAGFIRNMCGDEDGEAKFLLTPGQVVAASVYPGASCFSTIFFLQEFVQAIPGIGEWTAQYIALRALREPDAFPASDVGLLRGAGLIEGMRSSPDSLLKRAECWRPWRAYAAQHLWAAQAVRIPTGGTHG